MITLQCACQGCTGHPGQECHQESYVILEQAVCPGCAVIALKSEDARRRQTSLPW